jgi:hypothetical protein
MNFDETDMSQAKLIDLQEKVSQITEAFYEIDKAMLGSCTPQECALQAEFRHRLWEYVDQIWSEPSRKSRGVEHASHYPAYAGVGALRDLSMELLTNAQSAQHAAGDPVELTEVRTTVTVENE